MDKTEVSAVQLQAPACSVCGAALVATSRRLAGIHENDNVLVVLDYHTTMVCPKRMGLTGVFKLNHDRRLYRDDGSELVLEIGEIELLM